MKLLFLLFTILVGVSATFQEWRAYKLQYGKEYNLIEDVVRKLNYITNKNRIILHNLRFNQGRVSYRLGINQFTDMTFQEFSQIFTERRNIGGIGIFPPIPTFNPWPTIVPQPSPNPTPTDSVDWRVFGAVTPVQDQGTACSAGWAFAVAAALEGQTFRSTGTLPQKLSEQNLLDCVVQSGTNFCRGQKPQAGYEYIIGNQNINTQIEYPYVGRRGTCRYNPNDIGATCAAFENIPQGDVVTLQNIVQNLGPVAVGFDPLSFSFMHYESGVYSESGCSSTPASQHHYMTIVGYGTDAGVNFWIVKNSFGQTWGEQGYIRVLRNSGNQCGIATSATYPVV